MSNEQKPPKKKFSFRNSYGLKLLIILALILFFLIPLAFIKNLISERQSRRWEAEEDIVSSWGGEPYLAGPVLVVPYLVRERYFNEESKTYEEQDSRYMAVVFPKTLNMDITVDVEERHRGIYRIPVFTADLKINGKFSLEELQSRIKNERILYDEIKFVVALSEAKGITEISSLQWGGEPRNLRTGSGYLSLFNAELESVVPVSTKGGTMPYSYELKLHGGRALHLFPFGDDTHVTMISEWASPSFNGEYLPITRDLRDDGFTAEWQINSLSRPYPSVAFPWEMDTYKIVDSGFGVELFEPVNQYLRNERSVKYGFLFLLIPFLTFILFELLLKRKIHPVQYFLAGAGNIVFYLLLLSLTEHLGFDPAYILAALSVIILLSVYAGAVVKSWKKSFTMGAVLCISYLYLYGVLRSEDYALLFGSIGLFAAIALIMFLTRKIKWYGDSEN